jgi:hypothetical protein
MASRSFDTFTGDAASGAEFLFRIHSFEFRIGQAVLTVLQVARNLIRHGGDGIGSCRIMGYCGALEPHATSPTLALHARRSVFGPCGQTPPRRWGLALMEPENLECAKDFQLALVLEHLPETATSGATLTTNHCSLAEFGLATRLNRPYAAFVEIRFIDSGPNLKTSRTNAFGIRRVCCGLFFVEGRPNVGSPVQFSIDGNNLSR